MGCILSQGTVGRLSCSRIGGDTVSRIVSWLLFTHEDPRTYHSSSIIGDDSDSDSEPEDEADEDSNGSSTSQLALLCVIMVCGVV
jgi:hypothetical protein